MIRLRRLGAGALALGLFSLPLAPAWAADHLDAPNLSSPGGDGRLDINDVYVFQSPASPTNTVLVMTVNPAVGVFSPATLHPDAEYSFRIDRDGDAKEDLSLRLRASAPAMDGSQELSLRCTPARDCPAGSQLAEGRSGSDVAIAGGGTLRVDVFDDPFFFDLNAFLGSYDFCQAPGGTPGDSGDDFFAGLNVTAIVLEVPSSNLGPANIGVWAATTRDGQVDRMGRPAINTVFIPTGFKNAFNEGKPRKDPKKFGTFLGPLAGVLLPDVLTVDTSSAAGFLNGRQLADDVIDAELQIITGDPDASDCVDENDVPFDAAFPYLAPAH